MVNWHKLSGDLEQIVLSDPEHSMFPYSSTKEGNSFSLRKAMFIFECTKMKSKNQAILKYKNADNSYTLGAYLDILLKLKLENV